MENKNEKIEKKKDKKEEKKKNFLEDFESFPHFSTLALHAGQEAEQWKCQAVVPLISLSTTFKQQLPGKLSVRGGFFGGLSFLEFFFQSFFSVFLEFDFFCILGVLDFLKRFFVSFLVFNLYLL